MLCFQAKPLMAIVNCPRRTLDAVKMIGCIELQAGFGRQDFHGPPLGRLIVPLVRTGTRVMGPSVRGPMTVRGSHR